MPRPTAAASSRPFRLAHVSDLHLTAGGAPRAEPRLWGRLSGMNARLARLFAGCEALRQCDAILVTGDATDRGHLAAWEALRDIAAAAGLLQRLVVLPGNHDVACLSIRDRPGAEDMARARAGLALLGQPQRFPWARTLVPGRVALFCLDSTVKGNATGATNARGRLGEHQLVRLGKLLQEHRDVPVKLVALHHSPNLPRQGTSRRRGERPTGLLARLTHELYPSDRRTLRVLCGAAGVRLVLHGHTHDALDRRVGGVRMVGAPATTEPAGGALWFRRHTVAPLPPYRVSVETIRFPVA